MMDRLTRVAKPLARIARWYASPSGAVSAVALGAVFALAALGKSAWAIGVLALWLGLIVPYKLNRERSDRVEQAATLAARIKHNTNGLKTVQSDLAMTPTIEELADWQETVDIRIAAAQARFASLEQLGESLRSRRESP